MADKITLEAQIGHGSVTESGGQAVSFQRRVHCRKETPSRHHFLREDDRRVHVLGQGRP